MGVHLYLQKSLPGEAQVSADDLPNRLYIDICLGESVLVLSTGTTEGPGLFQVLLEVYGQVPNNILLASRGIASLQRYNRLKVASDVRPGIQWKSPDCSDVVGVIPQSSLLVP
jgi:hypothetical protein